MYKKLSKVIGRKSQNPSQSSVQAIYEFSQSVFEKMEQHANKHLRKWLGVGHTLTVVDYVYLTANHRFLLF